MMVLVTYDVSTTEPAGRRRLRRVARACLNVGQRVQKSVFECSLDNAQFVTFRAKLLREIDPNEDSLRLYCLGNNWRGSVEHVGIKPAFDPEGFLEI